MKFFLPTVFLFQLSIASLCCQGQLMKTLNDAHLLAENDSLLFRGKPLKNLLKEIGPEIKMVFVREVSWEEGLAYIVFQFVCFDDYFKCASPPGIRVMIKESFEWKKPKADYFKWTKADEERLGNLTIAYIRIYGAGKTTYAL